MPPEDHVRKTSQLVPRTLVEGNLNPGFGWDFLLDLSYSGLVDFQPFEVKGDHDGMTGTFSTFPFLWNNRMR